MRISDWSSDVCSSDLPPVGCDHASVHRHWRILIAPASALVPSAIIPKHVPHPARHAPPAHKDMAVRSCTPPRPWPAPLRCARRVGSRRRGSPPSDLQPHRPRSEEHTSELQSLMRISYAVFCLKKKTHSRTQDTNY